MMIKIRFYGKPDNLPTNSTKMAWTTAKNQFSEHKRGHAENQFSSVRTHYQSNRINHQ